MNELDEGKGIQLGEKDRSAFAWKEFVHAIADVSQKEISKYMASCKFLSVIVDGSCDSSITENEMVYIHTCVKGQVKTNICEMSSGSMWNSPWCYQCNTKIC